MVSTTKICACCEEEYTREVGSNTGRSKYCSKQCHNKIKRLIIYNISFKEMKAMIAHQDNKCAICRVDFDFIDAHSVNIDHCHKNGNVRGILCQTCNRGLGQFKDDVNLLKSAIVYLER